jgi:hypothetical protein
MSAELIVRSEIAPISWDEFLQNYPVGSIALEGFVGEDPQFEVEGPYLNANHHEGVKRLETLSTAQQILMDIRMGMDKAFVVDGTFSPKVFVNDCDQDVCTAWFLLNHIEQAKSVSNPSLNRFVNVAGTLDATAGAFPYDRDLRILGELNWVFEPYNQFRASGEMAKKDNSQYRSVIQSVDARIQQHLLGRGESIPLDPRYSIVGGGKDWKMIEEIGLDGRVGALIDGIDSYISVQEVSDDRWRYTIGKRSEFIPFDVTGIIERLNEVEECKEDRWGGATIIGGSPRVGSSKLSPPEVEKIVNEFLII